MASTDFQRVGAFQYGYDPDQVNEFLRRAKVAYNGPLSEDFDEKTVRTAAFDRVRKGYATEAVDAALDRLETAFIQKRRAAVVTDGGGESAWLNSTYREAKSLYPRLLRPAGQRFRDADGVGYAKADVDALVSRLSRYFDGKAELEASEIREAVFGRAKGRAAYDESVVDVYLERAVTVLLSVE